jgi:hypothetical protein
VSIGTAVLEEFGESFGLVGAEADHGAWLTPWLFKRVAHVADHRLSRRVR